MIRVNERSQRICNLKYDGYKKLIRQIVQNTCHLHGDGELIGKKNALTLPPAWLSLSSVAERWQRERDQGTTSITSDGATKA
ncbi:hypothetical protein EFS38_06750 [Dickeya undicola]|uniref:Uncharacterized protein n=1 Tax=Dickeya undicola TaxID=1577887 RepID=A0ABX9WVL6_9GAMM|nr:hypothetical protein EFS38_06750 [Dickeya undicola]